MAFFAVSVQEVVRLVYVTSNVVGCGLVTPVVFGQAALSSLIFEGTAMVKVVEPSGLTTAPLIGAVTSPMVILGVPTALSTVTVADAPRTTLCVTETIDGFVTRNVKGMPAAASPLAMLTTEVVPVTFAQPVMTGVPVMAMIFVPETNTGWAPMPP